MPRIKRTDALARNIRCATVRGFKECVLLANVPTWAEPEGANHAAGQVGHKVAVEVRAAQHIKLVRCLDEAGETAVGKLVVTLQPLPNLLSGFVERGEEEPVRLLAHIGL